MSIQPYINILAGNAFDGAFALDGVEDALDWRTVSQFDLDSHGGVGWIAYYNRQVLNNLILSMQDFVYGGAHWSGVLYWNLVFQGLNDQGSELTWKTICEAWVANDFEGKKWTIAIIDHMRKLMWVEPFSIQWAAKPKAEST